MFKLGWNVTDTLTISTDITYICNLILDDFSRFVRDFIFNFPLKSYEESGGGSYYKWEG